LVALVGLGVAVGGGGLLLAGPPAALGLLGGAAIGAVLAVGDRAETARPSLSEELYQVAASNTAEIAWATWNDLRPVYTVDRGSADGTGWDVDAVELVFLDRHSPVDGSLESAVALRPTGKVLFRKFRYGLDDGLREDPAALAEQLADGLDTEFGLVEAMHVEDVADDSVTLGVTVDGFGSVTGFDHPVRSFLGVGFVLGLDRPVTVESQTALTDRVEYFLTYSWASDVTDRAHEELVAQRGR
jgi:hypothetical protein